MARDVKGGRGRLRIDYRDAWPFCSAHFKGLGLFSSLLYLGLYCIIK